MTMEDIAKRAFEFKPLGCWILTLLVHSGGSIEMHDKDLAVLCGVSVETLKTARKNLIRSGCIRYRNGGNWSTNIYEIVV